MERTAPVEDMEEEEGEEDMDQTAHSSAPTPVIVSMSPTFSHAANVDSASSFTPVSRGSPGHSLFQVVSPEHLQQQQIVHHPLLTKKHLQVRQTLSEPGRNGRGHKSKIARLSPTRLSPIQHRKNDLGKTLSMGAALDTAAPNSVIWKPVEPRVGGVGRAESMQSEGSEDSPNSTPSASPHSLTANTRLPYMLGGQMPTQEQLEALYKQIPTSTDQLELMQKQMLALVEQQQKLASLGLTTPTTTLGGGAAAAVPGSDRVQLPLLWFGVPGLTTPYQFPTTSTSNSATPSPTPSTTTVSDSGLSSLSQMSGLSTLNLQPPQSTVPAVTREPLSLVGQQRRPLSESQSAPGFQSVPDSQFESLQKQFQVQQQQLLLQSQQINHHYLEQQQRLLQQAMIERKQFEEQQRQLSAMHVRQQTELQKKQQLLRQMQESQLISMQRQQQLLLLQSLQQSQQQQRQASQLSQLQQQASLPISMPHPQTSPQPNHKPLVRRVSSLSATSSTNSLHDGESRSLGSADISARRSPSLTPKAVLTPTNSYDSVTSNNGSLSPNVGVTSPLSGQESPQQGTTGLVYDVMMLKHGCNCGGSHAHPDHPGRLQSIWARLMETRVVNECRRLRARKASLAELQTIHSENHVRLYGRPTRRPGQEKKDSGRAFVTLGCGGQGVDRDTYWNDAHTSNASRMAAGSVIELAEKVITGEVKNGFAFVRPPGHHALPNQAQAFCYFNNVAVAAKAMLSKGKRVMVLDWDIHHGNGTQQIFYDSPSVLYVSIHRYDNGTFFPGTGRSDEIGSGAGLGFNVNIAFSGPSNFQGISAASNCGDAEYLSAFRSIVVPIAREFDPDLILVSAGFNATGGHPPTLGGYSLSTKCYAYMTRMLMSVGNGRVAMALEGGYELMSLCASAEACMRALLGLELPQLESASLEHPPQQAAVASMEKTITYHKSYWRCLSRSAHLLPLSHKEAEKREVEEADTVCALASLSVGGANPQQRIVAMQTAV